MVKYNMVAVLYSKKNYELSFKMNKWCSLNKVSFINIIDFIDLSIKIAQIKPTILFIDTSTVNYQKENLDLLNSSSQLQSTKIIYLASRSSQYNVKNFLQDNCNLLYEDEVKEYLDTYTHEFNLLEIEKEKKNLMENTKNSEDIGRFLINLKINPKHTGFYYLKNIIEYILMNDHDIIMLSRYYPLISALYKTNPANIERNIRNAIKIAWESHGKNEWCKTLNTTVFNFKNPTNREFICYTVERLLKQDQKHISNF